MKCRFSAVLLFSVLSLAALCARPQKPKREFQRQADLEDFWTLFDRDSKLSTVASGFGFTEGRVWDPAGFLIVSDEVANKIFRVYVDGRREELVSLGDPDGNTYDRHQQLIDCVSVLRCIIRMDRKGKYKILASRFEGKRFNSPNDASSVPTALFISPIQHSTFPKDKSRSWRSKAFIVSVLQER